MGTRKFYMILEDEKIRSLPELQKISFETKAQIKDFLRFYESGQLLRWLRIQKCIDEADIIEKITSKDKEKIFLECMKVLHMKVDNTLLKKYFHPEDIYVILGGRKILFLSALRELARDQFPIKDFLECYKSGKLVKWLEDRDCSEEAKGIKNIENKEDEKLFLKCIDILQINVKESEIEEYFYPKDLYLTLNGKKIRYPEGGRAIFTAKEFSIKNFMDFYESGQLLKWLEKENCFTEAYQIRQIKGSSKKEIFKKCIDLLHIDVSDSKIREFFCSYTPGYEHMLNQMKEHKNNLQDLRNDAYWMEHLYYTEFVDNYAETYNDLKQEAPKALIAILSIDTLGNFWRNDFYIHQDIYSNILQVYKIKELLSKNEYVVYKQNTNGMWVTVLNATVRIMVLYVSPGAEINSSNEYGGTPKYNVRFCKFNGLKFRSSVDYAEVYYITL